MQIFDFDIEYVKGIKNRGADALSRVWEDTNYQDIPPEDQAEEDDDTDSIKDAYILPSTAAIASDQQENKQIPNYPYLYQFFLFSSYINMNQPPNSPESSIFSNDGNTLYCQAGLHWTCCKNPDGCPYHYDDNMCGSAIPYREYKSFNRIENNMSRQDRDNTNKFFRFDTNDCYHNCKENHHHTYHMKCYDYQHFMQNYPDNDINIYTLGIELCTSCQGWYLSQPVEDTTKPVENQFQPPTLASTNLIKQTPFRQQMLKAMYIPLIVGTHDDTQFRTNAITRA